MSVISIDRLCKVYDGNQVLKYISLSFEAGQIIGYIGPNGAGKSTTIKILTGIIGDFEGNVHVLGMDMRKESIAIKQKIGYIPENAALYDVLTPVEYLNFIGRLYGMELESIKKKSTELLHLFDLGTKMDRV
jgi:ABC-2 type transport system ATP-binding protein